MYPGLGVVEVITSCVFGLNGISLPVANLVFLYMSYIKVKSIEELLKKE